MTVSSRMHHSSKKETVEQGQFHQGCSTQQTKWWLYKGQFHQQYTFIKELTLWQPTIPQSCMQHVSWSKAMLLQLTVLSTKDAAFKFNCKPEDVTIGCLTCFWFVTPNLIGAITALWDWVTAAPQRHTVTIMAAEIIWCTMVARRHIVSPKGIPEEICKIECWLIKIRWPFSQNGACVFKSAGFLVLDWQKHVKSCITSRTPQYCTK